MKDQSRDIVLKMLLETAKDHAKSHMILRHTLEQYDSLETREKAFMTRLYQGTLQKRIELDYRIGCVSKTPVRKMKPVIREILRMSLYQIMYMDRVPDAAAVAEGVKLAKKHGFASLSGFVNGVLRSLIRESGKIVYPDPEKEPVRHLSVTYAMPEWIAAHFLKLYGMEGAKRIFQGMEEERGTSLRVNQSLADPDTLFRTWEEAGVRVSTDGLLPYACRVSGVSGIHGLAGYREGFFCVQDLSSMLVGELAGAKGPGIRVLDMCAAPGGKSQHMADILACAGGDFQITACDVSPQKTALIEENIRRFGGDRIHTEVQDASGHRAAWEGQFDIVLADVPCSGLGVLGGKADLRHHITEEMTRSLAELQEKILANAASYVREGGLLLYSTCTVNPAENEEQIRRFLAGQPFEAQPLAPVLPEGIRKAAEALPGFDPDSGMLQILPGYFPADGFFIAKLRKKISAESGREEVPVRQ